MITIQGIYDGVRIIPTQQIPMNANTRVEITFLETTPINREEEMQHYLSTGIFDFWENEREERDVNDLGEK